MLIFVCKVKNTLLHNIKLIERFFENITVLLLKTKCSNSVYLCTFLKKFPNPYWFILKWTQFTPFSRKKRDRYIKKKGFPIVFRGVLRIDDSKPSYAMWRYISILFLFHKKFMFTKKKLFSLSINNILQFLSPLEFFLKLKK